MWGHSLISGFAGLVLSLMAPLANTALVAPTTGAPDCDLWLAQGGISAGQSTQLTWWTMNASQVTLAEGGANPASVASSGSLAVSPASSRTYTLVARNSYGGSKTCTATLSISGAGSDAPLCALSSTPGTHYAGQPVQLVWYTQHATAAQIANVGTVPSTQLAQGSFTVVPSQTTLYTMTAANAAGVRNTCSTLVTVSSSYSTPTYVYASPASPAYAPSYSSPSYRPVGGLPSSGGGSPYSGAGYRDPYSNYGYDNFNAMDDWYDRQLDFNTMDNWYDSQLDAHYDATMGYGGYGDYGLPWDSPYTSDPYAIWGNATTPADDNPYTVTNVFNAFDTLGTSIHEYATPDASSVTIGCVDYGGDCGVVGAHQQISQQEFENLYNAPLQPGDSTYEWGTSAGEPTYAPENADPGPGAQETPGSSDGTVQPNPYFNGMEGWI